MATLTESNAKTTTASIQVDKVEIEIIDGIEYKLFHNQYGPAMQVRDTGITSQPIITNFKSESQAGSTFDAAVAYARRVA